MKRRIIIGLCLIAFSIMLIGCESKVIVGGKEVLFDKQYQDYYITYLYPSIMQGLDSNNKTNQEYQLYDDNNQLALRLKVEQHSLILSFSPMEEDAKKLENNKDNKNVESKTITVNGKNLVRYSYRKNDEFGNDTLYYVYYGGYSYMGVSEYIKIYMINMDGNDAFESAFLSNFKINR